MTLPTYDDVLAAAARIAPYAVRTPLIENAALNERAGGRVLLKAETLQRTGSFKFRGACNRIALIPESDRAKGVVAFSSGNHAQGVAAAAGVFGVHATIVMPADAPKAKIAGTRALGAQIITYDRATEDREAIAAVLVARTGATLVKPFDDAGLIAGQGTAGLELLADARARGLEPDVVASPAGGGGLVAGISLALSGAGSKAAVFSVEPENFAGMKLSLEAGERTKAPSTPMSCADALMSPAPGVIPFGVAQSRLAGGIAVTDDELLRAVSYALRVLKLVVEPGGAAALAALLAGKIAARNRTVALILSGANADVETVMDAARQFPAP